MNSSAANARGESAVGEVTAEDADQLTAAPGFSLWARQTWAILRLELQKNFFNRRALILYLLAFLPVSLLALLAVFQPPDREWNDFSLLNIVFTAIYEGLILRTVVFFGCAWVFMNLFRGEVVDRSLHYYFLSPVRREVLVLGKYLSGLVTTLVLFGGATLVCNLLLYFPRGVDATLQYLFAGPGLRYLITYLLITALACLGYGAFFLAIGLLVRNPIVPALLLYGWEWINFLLPPVLKKVSVIHYLQSLSPVPMPEGPFALVAEPTPAWVSIPALLLMTGLLLAYASLQIRWMEIKYGGE
ncbi:MAG TPA: hypothetical protein VM870_11705 [Pyrinomonadaceae bacterium]|nr:hypothetical protein [Pyrinomonadaceae bacterium]